MSGQDGSNNVALPEDIAFSDCYPIIEPLAKPRNAGMIEVRSPAHTVERLSQYVHTFGRFVDSVKWTCATQRLMPRSVVREINSYLHDNGIEVSTGGLLETVLPHGERAIRRCLEEAKELGFDIVEISSALIAISVEDKARIVKAAVDLGLKAKPEINAWSPEDRHHTSATKVIREGNAMLEAGAWKLMIEEDGIFSVGNDPISPDKWNRDFAWQLASRFELSDLYWESSDLRVSRWLINSFGVDVNLFMGDEQLPYLAAFRSGAFVMRVARFGE